MKKNIAPRLPQTLFNKYSYVFLSLIFTVALQAQNGSIKGRITDKSNNEPLIGASVIIAGSSTGVAADFDGNFVIPNVKPGKYILKTSFISYRTDSIRGVVVEAGKETVLDIQLSSADISLKEVEVIARANRESENILLLEQKQAVIATQAVGAKEMSRKGISNAEAAVAQVSGVSKQEGIKNVFVRGLGDRYNATMLNGFPIPSEDPEYKNISLDFFGSDVIQNIGVSKVFSGNNYGDVGGAVINIASKELVGEKELNTDLAAGANTKTIGNDFLKPDGVNYLGISASTQPASDYKTVWGFSNSLDPTTVSLPLNHSYGFSGGKSYKLGEKQHPLSFYLIGSYSSGYSYTDELVVNTTSTGEIVENLDGYKYSQNINQLVLANVNLGLNKKSEFDYNFMLVHDNNQSVGHYIGSNAEFTSSTQPDEYENDGFLRRQQTNDNLLITNQLLSKTKLSEKLKLDAGLSYNFVKGVEPDRRVNNLFRKSATQYELLSGSGVQVRNYTELQENDYNAKFALNYELPEKFKDDASSIQVGYDGRYVTDDFSETEYSMTAVSNQSLVLTDAKAASLTLDELYNQDNLTNNKFQQYDKIVSTYDVTKFINAGYAAINYQFSPKLTGNVGLRAEQVYLKINYNIHAGNVANDSKIIDPFYFLPSLNLKYDINTKNTLRLGLSKTYTLPQSKEISPYQYVGMNFKSQGNPHLTPSDNYNVDLKWDYYLSGSELISLTGFYKYIKNPIARIEVGNAGGYLTYRNISDFATVTGLETEIRKNIFNATNAASEKTNKLTAGINASYIYSNLRVENIDLTPDKDSQLEGAAPFIVNFDLSHNYTNKKFSTTNSLVINYFSDRIYTIGTQGFEDIIEQGIPTLNFVSITKLNKHLGLKIKAGNILDPTFTLTRKGNNGGKNITLSQYKKGVDLSLGITYEF